MESSLVVDTADDTDVLSLLQKYDTPVPRYTSYPTANEFSTEFDPSDFTRSLQPGNGSGAPLSLYVHLPFCSALCYYCACNRVVTRKRQRIDEYLGLLFREIDLRAAAVSTGRVVRQLHFGGGTPTYIGAASLVELMHHLASTFALTSDENRDYAVEIDPRRTDLDTLSLLYALGFNRISMGIQDFDPRVQAAINRRQPETEVRALITAARQAGFRSVHYDLICGLPEQTPTRFRSTLDTVVQHAPERVSIFAYAHLPDRFPAQRLLESRNLPGSEQKLQMRGDAARVLEAAGYVHIGFDHFARADDPLVRAAREDRLQRNFQGYSTWRGLDLIGLGASAISSTRSVFAQNRRAIPPWSESLRAGKLPVERGYTLNHDDRIRQRLIEDLCVRFELDIHALEDEFDIDFPAYFARELKALRRFADDGCLTMAPAGFRVTPLGRHVIRQICATFDRHLSRQRGAPTGFSRIL